MNIKMLFAILTILLTFGTLSKQAHAYVDVTTDPSYNHKTYSVTASDLSPVAAATDVFTISGSTSKTIRIYYVEITADATAAGVIDMFIYKRTTLDVGGTFVSLIPGQNDTSYPQQPTVTAGSLVVGQTYVVSATSTNCTAIGSSSNTIGTAFIATGVGTTSCTVLASATASVLKYSANPTTLGVGSAIKGSHYALPAAATTGIPVFVWGSKFDGGIGQTLVLRGVNESMSIYLEGATIPSGMNMYIHVAWIEE